MAFKRIGTWRRFWCGCCGGDIDEVAAFEDGAAEGGDPEHRFKDVRIDVQSAYRKQTGSPVALASVHEAVAALHAALRNGRLVAHGLRDGQGDHQPVPTVAWPDLRIRFDPLHAWPADKGRPGASHWHRLRFAAEDIIRLWPTLLPADTVAAKLLQQALPTGSVADLYADHMAKTARAAVDRSALADGLAAVVEVGHLAVHSATEAPKPSSTEALVSPDNLWRFLNRGDQRERGELDALRLFCRDWACGCGVDLQEDGDASDQPGQKVEASLTLEQAAAQWLMRSRGSRITDESLVLDLVDFARQGRFQRPLVPGEEQPATYDPRSHLVIEITDPSGRPVAPNYLQDFLKTKGDTHQARLDIARDVCIGMSALERWSRSPEGQTWCEARGLEIWARAGPALAEMTKADKSAASPQVTRQPSFSPARLEEWYRDEWIQRNCATEHIPSADEDWAAAKQEVGHVSRDSVRDCRRRFAPAEWTRKGRRKTKKSARINPPRICGF